jgi:hypothetical protein
MTLSASNAALLALNFTRTISSHTAIILICGLTLITGKRFVLDVIGWFILLEMKTG